MLLGIIPRNNQTFRKQTFHLRNFCNVPFFTLLMIVVSGFVIWMVGLERTNKPERAYIFTFWEPRDKIPGYVRLCMKTWDKYLPNYQIIILDYSNLNRYLGYRMVKKVLSKDMTLPIQADGIRVAALRKYGGIWMDADTIITNASFLTMFNDTDLGLFGPSTGGQNIGFIYAKKNSTILAAWLRGIIQNVRSYKRLLCTKKYFGHEFLNTNNLRISYPWNYLGNSIIDPLVKHASGREYRRVDRDRLYVMPELLYNKDFKTSGEMYQHYYFEKGSPDDLLEKSGGIIMLHNSWTPPEFKRMSAEQFLQQDILLSKLLATLLQ